MEGGSVRVLLVEDNPGDARLIREMLEEINEMQCTLVWAQEVSEATARLEEGGIDVILLDLQLPDCVGLETLERIAAAAGEEAIIVLTGSYDESLGKEAVRAGAQDYLLKDRLNIGTLERSITYAMGRQRLLEEVRSLSLVDELTGLHNRRGFLTLGRQQLKIAKRTGEKILLVYVDVDHMKWINDTLGHAEGDRALLGGAEVLKRTFREADIPARIGGDEFAVLVMGPKQEHSETLMERLQARLDRHNAAAGQQYDLSLSVGITSYDSTHPCSIEELLARGDRLMYEQKREKGGSRVTETGKEVDLKRGQ